MKNLHRKQQSNIPVALEMLMASAKECSLATRQEEKRQHKDEKYIIITILPPECTYLATMVNFVCAN